MRKLTNIYADFETINNLDNLRVRSWALTYNRKDPISKTNYKNYKGYHTNYGIDISSFITFIENLKGQDYNIYFNNMRKFDGYFILPELYRRGYKLVPPFEYITMTKQDLLDEDEMENFLIMKNLAMERAIAVFNRFKDEVPKDKNKRLSFLKKKWRSYHPKEFSLMLADNKIYSIKIGINDKKKNTTKYRAVEIKCFLSLFDASVENMGKSLAKKYPEKGKDYFLKGKGDYTITTPYNNIKDLENDKSEFNYLLQDCFITLKYGEEMAKVMPINDWKITIASTCYNKFMSFYGAKYGEKYGYQNKTINHKTGYKRYISFEKNWKLSENQIGRKIFNEEYPTKWLDVDTHLDMRKWYKGGIVLVNEKYRGVVKHNITQVDITSSYPNIMNSDFQAPFGAPVKGNSKFHNFKFYRIALKRRLTNYNGLPFVPDPQGRREWPRTLEKGSIIHLTTNSIDIFKRYYKAQNKDLITTVEYSFYSRPLKETFGNYVNHFFDLKKVSGKNTPERNYAKLMNNSLYGKFGSKLVKPSTYVVDGKGIAVSTISKTNYYLPLAVAITELARLYLVKAIGDNFDKVVYVDTDSASIINFNVKDFPNIKIGNGDVLGEWTFDIENKTMLARRAKQYAFWDKQKLLKLTLSGFNGKKLLGIKNVSYMAFLEGMEFKGQTQGIIYKIKDGVKKYLNGCYIETINKILPAVWDIKSYKPLSQQKIITKNDYLARLPKTSLWNSSLSG